MPLFMDVHERLPEGATEADLVMAHAADVEVGQSQGVRYLRFWFSEASRKAFCLVEAPSAEAAAAVHRDAHGLVADRIYEVHEGE